MVTSTTGCGGWGVAYGQPVLRLAEGPSVLLVGLGEKSGQAAAGFGWFEQGAEEQWAFPKHQATLERHAAPLLRLEVPPTESELVPRPWQLSVMEQLLAAVLLLG